MIVVVPVMTWIMTRVTMMMLQERKYCNAWLDRQRGDSCLMDDPNADVSQRNAAKLEADTLYPVFRCPLHLSSC